MKLMLIGSSQVSIPPETGGAVEAIIYDIARLMQKKNEVLVASRKKTSNELRYVLIPSKLRKNKAAYIVQDIVFGLKCVKAIRKNKPDIVHLHTTFVSFPIMFFKRFLPGTTKIVYTSHSPAWTVDDKEIGWANRIFNKIEGFVMKRTDMNTTVSDSQRIGMLNRNAVDRGKITTIPNYSRNMLVSEKTSGKTKGPVVLFVGKLTETKGIPYLLAASKEVTNKIKDAKFVLVGSLEHGQELDKNPWEKLVPPEAKDNVIFTGSVSLNDLKRLYSSASVFVLPSLREGMPLVILEAVASGLPVVTTRVSGTKEVVNEKCAIFVKRKDSAALAEAIIKILTNKKLAKRMSIESKKVSKKFEMEATLKKYSDLYESLTA